MLDHVHRACGPCRRDGDEEIMTSTEIADSLRTHVSAFRERRVLVIGDAILDEYLYGETGRISPEAPVPVLRVTKSRQVLGGAANTAANIVSLGARATLIALIGNDDGGAALRDRARDAGIDLRGVNSGAPSLRKTRVVSQQQQMIRLDYEDPKPMTSAVAEAVLAAFDDAVADADIVVMSDYAKGVLSERMSQNIITRAHKAGRDVIVDPRPQNRACYVGCDYLTPNWKEARALLRLPEIDPTPERVGETARALAAELNANIVLTLGPHGIMFCSRDGREMFSQPTLAREVFDVSGAGDTVVAAFSLARASRIDHPTAVSLANRAASVVVGKFGTATVTPEELLETSDASRLIPRSGLAPLATRLRSRGRKIVTINGSFDLLHGGHLHILNEAKGCGDVLIVGLNSDASVRGYKGPDRPIVPEDARAQMLLALRMVDFVHIFDEADPIAFLREVRPDVHVNGSEYGEDCIEADTVKEHGGTIHIVHRLPGLSTSGLLDAIQTRRV
jgi:D-beta-D-heptose 7-phosphate kinase/D-beta-D-heptose 1-phosphate adenosyltransferase